MQQTEHHKLNLIEPDDTFSTEALNENTRAIDAVLTRFTCGTYTGNGTKSRKIDLPFTPKLVYVGDTQGNINTGGMYPDYCGGVALRGAPAIRHSTVLVEIVEGGFQVFYHSNSYTTNMSQTEYRYFAIG